MELAGVVATRSNCLRMQVGAIIVKDKRIIATGYNGTPHGITNCIDGGCARCLDRDKNKLVEGQDKELCICIHAEQNAIIQSALHGASTQGAELYTTVEPCNACSKMIINAGIVRVTFREAHHRGVGLDLLKKAGVAVVSLPSSNRD